jgi:hypothetical protein
VPGKEIKHNGLIGLKRGCGQRTYELLFHNGKSHPTCKQIPLRSRAFRTERRRCIINIGSNLGIQGVGKSGEALPDSMIHQSIHRHGQLILLAMKHGRGIPKGIIRISEDAMI